jgi:NAD(P)-dependent dehydrogenase (short-subunit alcohol dehydrogenase family)
MTKHNACVHGRNTIIHCSETLQRTEPTIQCLPTKKMNAIEEPSMKRSAKPGEVSKIVARVASSSFSFATGNTLVIGGGIVLL